MFKSINYIIKYGSHQQSQFKHSNVTWYLSESEIWVFLRCICIKSLLKNKVFVSMCTTGDKKTLARTFRLLWTAGPVNFYDFSVAFGRILSGTNVLTPNAHQWKFGYTCRFWELVSTCPWDSGRLASLPGGLMPLQTTHCFSASLSPYSKGSNVFHGRWIISPWKGLPRWPSNQVCWQCPFVVSPPRAARRDFKSRCFSAESRRDQASGRNLGTIKAKPLSLDWPSRLVSNLRMATHNHFLYLMIKNLMMKWFSL